eukprot:scaffold301_cov243-Pinguiococcus_pyrenoidosus.AAC.126
MRPSRCFSHSRRCARARTLRARSDAAASLKERRAGCSASASAWACSKMLDMACAQGVARTAHSGGEEMLLARSADRR